MNGGSWTCPRTVVLFSCRLWFADFAAVSVAANVAFSQSGSMTRWPADLLGVRSGWRRSSTISELPWGVVLPQRWRGG
jgi:hypothetical protein